MYKNDFNNLVQTPWAQQPTCLKRSVCADRNRVYLGPMLLLYSYHSPSPQVNALRTLSTVPPWSLCPSGSQTNHDFKSSCKYLYAYILCTDRPAWDLPYTGFKFSTIIKICLSSILCKAKFFSNSQH
jgi:hypothetical protein